MQQLITKKMYLPLSGETAPIQILKNKGYVSIALHSALYNAPSNFWQKVFGGANEMTLTSTIFYKNGPEEREAKAVLDKRSVKTDQPIPLSIYRSLATKVPTTADALRLEVALVSTKKDNLGHALELMNSEDLQIPFEVAPFPIGQIVSTANVIKKILSGIDPKNIVPASYGGIISDEAAGNADSGDRLFAGYLILLVDEGDGFLETLDKSKITVEDDGLAYEGKRLQCTNLVFEVKFDVVRSEDQNSNWFKKFQKAYDHLYEILLAATNEEKEKIKREAIQLFIEGAVLLSADRQYVEAERRAIKNQHLKGILDRYAELTNQPTGNLLRPLMESATVDLGFLPVGERLDVDGVYAEIQTATKAYQAALESQGLARPA